MDNILSIIGTSIFHLGYLKCRLMQIRSRQERPTSVRLSDGNFQIEDSELYQRTTELNRLRTRAERKLFVKLIFVIIRVADCMKICNIAKLNCKFSQSLLQVPLLKVKLYPAPFHTIPTTVTSVAIRTNR